MPLRAFNYNTWFGAAVFVALGDAALTGRNRSNGRGHGGPFSRAVICPRYKLMINLIVPWPIALVTTVGADGVVNAAPFSVFTWSATDPPMVMISINKLGGAFKDTARNILATGQFVVHIVDEAAAVAMDATADPLPPDQ